MSDIKVGVQLYSVREPLKEDFKGTLKELVKMGVQGVEFAFFYGGLEPLELAAFLDEAGLSAIGIYEHLDNICSPDSEVYSQADALACQNLTFGFGADILNEDFDGCLQKCEQALQVSSQKGKSICYHAHAHEFTKINGQYQLDLLLNNPKLKKMEFEADTCWIHEGGENVIGYMEKYADRIPLLHVKDVTAKGKITEIGNGVIDFAAVVDFAKKNQIPWLSYEQDSTELPGLESVQISIENLKKLL